MEYKIKVTSRFFGAIMLLIFGCILLGAVTTPFLAQSPVSITINGHTEIRAMALKDYLLFSAFAVALILSGAWVFKVALNLRKAVNSEIPVFNYTITGVERVRRRSKNRTYTAFYVDCFETQNSSSFGNIKDSVRYDISSFGILLYADLEKQLRAAPSIHAKFGFLDTVSKDTPVKIYI